LDDEVGRRKIDEWKIYRAVRRGLESRPLHVSNDAHDRRPWTLRAAALVKPAANHLLAGEEPVGPRAIDQDGVLLERVFVEQAAPLQPQADGSEEVGRHANPGTDRLILPRQGGAILEIEVVALSAVARR